LSCEGNTDKTILSIISASVYSVLHTNALKRVFLCSSVLNCFTIY